MITLTQEQSQKMWNDMLQGVEACQFILDNTTDDILTEQYKRYKKHLLQSMNMLYETPTDI